MTKPKSRKWSSTYLSYGFKNKPVNGTAIPFCLSCHPPLQNESCEPYQLKAHQKKCQPSEVGLPLNYFKEKLKKYEGQDLSTDNMLILKKVKMLLKHVLIVLPI